MKVQKYTCWLSTDDEPTELNKYTYTAPSPEVAAEFLAEDVHATRGFTSDEIFVDVEAEDGTVYGITVGVHVTDVSFRAKS